MKVFFLLFTVLQVFCAHLSAESRFEGLSAFDRFNPYDVTVEDTTVETYAELPSGDVVLRNYHAPDKVLEKYCSLHNLDNCTVKDFPKAPNCTRAELDAIKLWTTNDIYSRVNAALRYGQKGKLNGEPISEKTESEALVLASALNCAPQYEGIAVRLENTPEMILDQYLVENKILARGFTSASKGTLPAQSMEPLNYRQKITYSRVRGADIDSMQISVWPREREVILLPGVIFRVESRQDFEHNPLTKYWTLLGFVQAN